MNVLEWITVETKQNIKILILKKFVLLLTAILFLICFPSFASGCPKFPSAIIYKILKNNQFSGVEVVKLQYSEQSRYPNAYALILEGFEGLGYKSDDKIFTYVLKDDLSLYDTQLMKDGKVVHEIKLVKRGDPFDPSGKKRNAFAYLEAGATSTIDTLFNYVYKVINLPSLFLFVSEKVCRSDMKVEKLYFFTSSIYEAKVINLVYSRLHPTEEIVFNGENIDTTVIYVRYQGIDIFKFNIYNDKFCLPVRVLIDSDYEIIELRATEFF